METKIDYGKVVQVDVNDLKLDRKNFRLDFEQISLDEQTAEMLFDEEDILDIAEDIVSANGLSPLDNFLAVIENGKKIVIEGNRRLLAINCILNPELVPERFRNDFNNIISNASSDMISKVGKVNVVFFKSREETKQYIASKHSGESTKQWSLISQWRHIKYEYDTQEKSVEKTVNSLKISREKVINSIKWFNIIQYGRGLGFWDDEHLRSKISKNRLEASRMTRALEYKEILAALGISFSENYEVIHAPELTSEKFNFLLFKFLKSSLIDVGSEIIDTRTPTSEILQMINRWKSEYDSVHPASASETVSTNSGTQSNGGSRREGDRNTNGNTRTTSGDRSDSRRNRTGSGGHTEKYLKSLKRHLNIEDDRINRLTAELSYINYTRNPVAALMLIRALLESTLLYQIKSKNMFSELREQSRGEPRLDDIVKFSLTNKDRLFANPQLANSLQYVQQAGGHRKFLNDVVHDTFIDPTTAHAELISGDLRNLFIAIISGGA